MDDIKLEELRENYYNSILLLEDHKDIEDSLPSIDSNFFDELMEGLVDSLNKRIEKV